MKRYLTQAWLATGALSGLLALGCGHSRRHCECTYVDCTMPMPAHVVQLPAPLPNVTVGRAEPQEPAETRSVMVPMAFPAPEGSSDGSVTGTVLLSAAEAKAMGIRPGYTPGALYVTDTPADLTAGLPQAEEAEKK
jgi:hypothetical protein